MGNVLNVLNASPIYGRMKRMYPQFMAYLWQGRFMEIRNHHFMAIYKDFFGLK
jgi:hypothetical protein